MGRKTTSLSSSNVSESKSGSSSHLSSVITKSSGITRGIKSLTPDIPPSPALLSSSPSPSSSCPSASGISNDEFNNNTAQSKLLTKNKSSSSTKPAKRPRSVGSTVVKSLSRDSGCSSNTTTSTTSVGGGKKHRALLSASALPTSNEILLATASSTRKRPSSSNSETPKFSEEFLETFSSSKHFKSQFTDQQELSDNEDSSASNSYWLRSSSVMKRVSNPEAGTGGRSSKQIPGQHSNPLQASNEQQQQQQQAQKSKSSSGILASLVGGGSTSTSSKTGSQHSSSTTNTRSSVGSKAAALTTGAKSSFTGKLPSIRSNNNSLLSAQQSGGASRRHGAKLLSSVNAASGVGQSNKLTSPRESGARHSSGSAAKSSSTAASGAGSLGDVAASFANAAAAMNSMSSSDNNSASGLTLPSGQGADGSSAGASSGAASLLRQFGKFLSRGGSHSGPTSARAMSLINQLQSATFDTEQLQCLQDLCDIINMNTEDVLQEFPARQASVVFTELMSGASGFEVAISACRALTYMLDCVPHASKSVGVDTIRCLISKLNDIECIDIAEQALSALEFLSASHHSKAVLRAGGVSACLQFIDFFSTLCQQKSLTIVANCCVGISPNDFAQIRSCIDRLSQQLLNQDRKCAELVSLSFSYIVSGCERDESVLRDVASNGYLLNAQQVLVQSPPVVGPPIYCQIFSTLSTICRRCPDQAVQLLQQNFPATLAFLLTGNRDALAYSSEEPTVVLSSGNSPGGVCSGSQELAEIVTLVSELLPPPPDEELFSTFPAVPQASALSSSANPLSSNHYIAAFLQSPFEWSDNPFSFLASSPGADDDQDELDPTAQALLAMQSAVMGNMSGATDSAASSGKRSGNNNNQNQSSSTAPPKSSLLADLYVEKPQLFQGLVATLTGPLLDICQTTTAGTIELKAKCLETLQRLLLVAPNSVLDSMIKAADLSSCLAQFLATSSTNDLRVAGLALQICHLLLRRCPDLFASQAIKQGISHQIAQTLVFVTVSKTNDNSTSSGGSGSSNNNNNNNNSFGEDRQSVGGSTSRPGSGEFFPTETAESGDQQQIVESEQSAADQQPPPPPQQQQARRSNSRLSGVKATAAKASSSSSGVAASTSKANETPSSSSQRPVRSSSRNGGSLEQQQRQSTPEMAMEDADGSIAAAGFRKLRSTVKSVLSRGRAAVGGSGATPGAAPSNSSSRPSSGTVFSPGYSGGRSRSHGNRQHGRSHRRSSAAALSADNAAMAATNNFHAQLRMWILQWARSFLEKLQQVIQRCETADEKDAMLTSTAVFSSLKAATAALVNTSNFQPHLVEIRDLVMTQNFSLFELGSSGLTDSLVRFFNVASADHLRVFLKLFAVLPPGMEMKLDGVRTPESFQRQPFVELVTKLIGCFQQVEQFEVKSASVRDRSAPSLFSSGSGIMSSSLLAAAMASSGSSSSGAAAFSVSPVVRFFSTCSLKLELRRAQQQQSDQQQQQQHASNSKQQQQSSSSRLSSSSNSVPSCLVRIDPLLTVDVLSRWIVQKGLHSSSSGLLSSFGFHRTSRHHHGNHHSQNRNSLLDTGADTSSVSGTEDFDDGDSSIAEFSSSTLTEDGAAESSVIAASGSGDVAGSSNRESNNNRNSMPSSSTSPSSAENGVQVELLLDGKVLPPEMTLYQAVAQYGLGISDEALFSLSASDALFQSPHTINFRLRSSNNNQQSPEEDQQSSTTKRRSKVNRKLTEEQLASLGVLDDFLRKPPSAEMPLEPSVSDTLTLLYMLYGLSRYWYTLFDVTQVGAKDGDWWFPSMPVKSLLPVEDFMSPKLNLKAQRQLRDTFVLATGIVPNWLQQVCSNWPFLLSFEVRQQIFYLTTFGRDRGILRLNHTNHSTPASSNAQQMQSSVNSSSSQVAGAGSGTSGLSASDQAVSGWLSRIVRSVEKRRYEVTRSQLLGDAMRVLRQSSLPAFRSSIVEIQYKNEVGVGLGPTLEFYALVSRQLQSRELDLWHAMDACDRPGAFLYPKSHNSTSVTKAASETAKQHGGVVELFHFLGQFVARAIVDGRMVDLNFSPLFVDRLLMSQSSQSQFRPLPTDLLWIDHVLARSVAHLVQISRHESTAVMNKQLDDLMIDFAIPGRPDAGISPTGGSNNAPVNAENVQDYISALLNFFLSSGISNFITAFSNGFNTVFPLDSLRRFFCSPSEIEAFLGGCNDIAPWDAQALREAIRPDHGYNLDSPVIRWLIDVLVGLDYVQRRLFLQFATGTPRLPLGGFGALNPSLTVVRRALEQSANPDDFLPSVMTCANYLKMPEYSSSQILQRKLLLAITDGQETFHLS